MVRNELPNASFGSSNQAELFLELLVRLIRGNNQILFDRVRRRYLIQRSEISTKNTDICDYETGMRERLLNRVQIEFFEL